MQNVPIRHTRANPTSLIYSDSDCDGKRDTISFQIIKKTQGMKLESENNRQCYSISTLKNMYRNKIPVTINTESPLRAKLTPTDVARINALFNINTGGRQRRKSRKGRKTKKTRRGRKTRKTTYFKRNNNKK
jgi:hypothetical protein